MLREHDASTRVRVTPIEEPLPSKRAKARTAPAPLRKPSKNKRKRPMPNNSSRRPIDNSIIEVMDSDLMNDVSDLDDTNEELVGFDYSEEDIETELQALTSHEINQLRSAIFNEEDLVDGKVPLQCKGLSKSPRPADIEDRFSAVLGDIFHAMNRTRVPVKHEVKKHFFVALMNAFLVWDLDKLNELEDHMRDGGMDEKEVQNQQYHNRKLYTSAVNRYAPSPKTLYWRVQAVYVMYGNMTDSKTKKALFNAEAWKKADNVLKEILQGFYSDPPGFEMYTKRLNKKGSVMLNKYKMEMIDCCRGTNRTEAFHKQLVTTFGTWHTGVERSDFFNLKDAIAILITCLRSQGLDSQSSGAMIEVVGSGISYKI